MPNNFISLVDAIKMTTRFRNNQETVLASSFKDKNILPRCESFDRAAFDDVLAQDGCTGLRVYFGMDDDDKVKVIIVGVDSNDNDMLPNGTNYSIVDNGTRCPQFCPPPSVLNTSGI